MLIKRTKVYNNKIPNLFFIISFLVFVFFSSYDSFGAVDLPIPVITLFILFQAISFFSFNLKYEFKIPTTLVSLLGLRALIFTIGGFFNKIDILTILYEISFTFLCIYLVSFTYSFSSKSKIEITIMLALFSTFTTFQILINILLNGFAKAVIASGIGMSNYAATFILISFCYFLFYSKKWYLYLITFICLLGILLTQSFGAYIATAVMIIIRLFKKYKFSDPDIWIILIIIIVFGIIFLVILSKTELGAPIVNKILEKINLLLNGNFHAFGSSRIELYKFTFNNFYDNWLFGNINNFDPDLPLNYRFQNSRAHNFILESLIYYGILGSLVNLALAIYIIKFIRKKKLLNSNSSPIIYAFIGTLIHGFVEPNFFTMHFEIFFWVLVGCIVSNNHYSVEKEKFKKKYKINNFNYYTSRFL